MRLRSAVRHVLGEGGRFSAPPADHALPRMAPLAGSGVGDRSPDCAHALPAETSRAPVPYTAVPPNPAVPPQRRGAYRVGVAVNATVAWPNPKNPKSLEGTQGVVVNLSGSGAQVRLRHMPPLESVLLSIDPPEAFVEDRARCQLCRPGGPALFPALGSSGFRQIGEDVLASLRSVESRVVHAKAHVIESAGPIFTLSLAFLNPHDGCFRLVRYLERLSLKADGGRFSLLSP